MPSEDATAADDDDGGGGGAGGLVVLVQTVDGKGERERKRERLYVWNQVTGIHGPLTRCNLVHCQGERFLNNGSSH